MGRVSTSLRVIGCSSLVLLLGCEESTPPLFGADAGLAGGLPGVGGSGGGGGRGPERDPDAGPGAGGGLVSTDAGLGGAGVAVGCDADADCEDDNDCTGDTCDDGVCSNRPVDEGVVCGDPMNGECSTADTCDSAGVCRPNDSPAGTPCGDPLEGACTSPDSCDGLGICAPRHALAGTPCGDDDQDECSAADACDEAGACSANDLPNGSACDDGSCTLGECIEDQPVGCPVDVVNDVPFNTSWRTVGRVNLFGGGCDIGGTPDYAVVFTAPTSGTFRFEAAGVAGQDDPEGGNAGAEALADSVLTIAEGSCEGMNAQQLACNDDIAPGNLDSRLDLALSLGDVVTVYVSELREQGGGSGTLSITER
jgi:hypothetical protein